MTIVKPDLLTCQRACCSVQPGKKLENYIEGKSQANSLDGQSKSDSRLLRWRPACHRRISVGVIESDRLVQEGLIALLNNDDEFECIGGWSDATEAIADLERLAPDVLLVDIRRIRKASAALTSHLQSLLPRTSIITAMDTEGDESLRAHSDAIPLTLNESVKAPVTSFADCVGIADNRGFQSIADRIFEAFTCVEPCGSGASLAPASADSDGTGRLGLTSREWQVVDLIGIGCSNKEIARELGLEYSTVKNYVSSAIKKLNVDGRTQIALLANRLMPLQSP